MVALAVGALLTLLVGPAGATRSVTLAEPPVADLSVTAFGSFGSVTFTVTNNGPGEATAATLTGSASGPWSLVGDVATCTSDAGGFSCPFGTLTPGAVRTIGVLTQDECGGFQSASGTASTTSNDPNPGNNTASDSPVQGICVGCSVSVDANAGPDQTVAAGAAVTLQGGPDPSSVPTCVGGGADASWQQIAGPPVNLDFSSGLLTPHFTAPQDPNGALLTFRFTESSGDQSASDTVDITVKPQPFPDTPRALACADRPVPRADGTIGIAIDLDKATYDSGSYRGATFTLARFYRGVGATCENRGGSPTGETEFGYPVWK